VLIKLLIFNKCLSYSINAKRDCVKKNVVPKKKLCLNFRIALIPQGFLPTWYPEFYCTIIRTFTFSRSSLHREYKHRGTNISILVIVVQAMVSKIKYTICTCNKREENYKLLVKIVNTKCMYNNY
jgi:hypothetical protein